MGTSKNNKSKKQQADENTIPENLLTPVEPTLVANMERVVELATISAMYSTGQLSLI